ncbi:hypothetical protein DFH11DRAFT_1731386 [Phellopilus nigrolimitatus]|nr:hypothetical protein DFH11DRAFT_1731386 [Phellopilus nigrolimitatus]
MANTGRSSGQGSKRPNEDADEINRPSTKPRTQPPEFIFIEDRYDELVHHELDEDTATYLRDNSMAMPATIPEWILVAVADTCDRLDSQLQKYPGAHQAMLEHGTALEDLLKGAYEKKDYKEVRNLLVLQQDKSLYQDVSHGTDDKGQQKQAVKQAWTVTYNGKAHHLLYETVRTMTKEMGKRVYANSLAIVQSSGTGKSRTVHEHSKLIFTIPFNLRSDRDQKGFAYPFPDRKIRDHLCQNAPKELQAARLHFMEFLHNLFSVVFDEVKALEPEFKVARTYGEVAKMWSAHLEKGRDELYQKVLDMKYDRDEKAFKVFKESKEKRDKEQAKSNPDPAKTDGRTADSAAHLFVAEQTKDKISALISIISKFAKVNDPSDARVVIYFDEAHDLTNIIVPDKTGSVSRTLYHAFCSTANGILDTPVFFLFLSTHSSLSKFAPPQWMYPSARVYDGEDTIQPPFTELPFDCSQDGPVIRPGEKALRDVATIKFMSAFGRPMFFSLLKSGEPEMEWSIINLARSKLIGRNKPDSAEMTDDAKLAVLAVRVLLNFNTSRSKTQARLVKLVQSHMAIAFSIPQHRETIRTGYPSEPILAEAAARQMRILRSRGGSDSPSQLLKNFLETGVIDKGERGELVARLIFTLAYDDAAEAYERDTSENLNKPVDESSKYPFYSKGVPLEYFIKALFGDNHAERILESHPDNVADGKTFREVFDDAWVRFTHFQRAGDSSVVSTEAAWAAAARAMAFQCSSGQAVIDMVIPVILRREGKLGEDIMTAILVQDKDRFKAGTRASVEIDAETIKFFPEQSSEGPKEDKRPYITIVMELGVLPFYQTQAKYEAPPAEKRPPVSQSSLATGHEITRKVRSTKTAKEAHPRYAIFVNGCSPSVYKVVDNEDVYAALLSSRHTLQEHPRQTPDALSAVRRLKPFWIKGPECFDWTDDPKLSGVIPVEEPVAEGVTTGEDQLELGSAFEEG